MEVNDMNYKLTSEKCRCVTGMTQLGMTVQLAMLHSPTCPLHDIKPYFVTQGRISATRMLLNNHRHIVILEAAVCL